MCPAYEVKVVSVEEFWNNVRPKSEADSTVVFTPALKIESYICVVVVVVVVVVVADIMYFCYGLPRIHNQLISTTWAGGCFRFHLDCSCQLGHDFAIEKFHYRSLSAWCPILWKIVYILSEFYLGHWPLHLLDFVYILRQGLFSFFLSIFFVFTWTSLSGSDHKRSQRRPVSGTSVGRMIRLK